MTVDQFLRWGKHVGALSKQMSSAISYKIKVVGKCRVFLCCFDTVLGNCNLSLKSKLQNLQDRTLKYFESLLNLKFQAYRRYVLMPVPHRV